MELQQILNQMINAGFHVYGTSPDRQFIIIEDPTCILRAFATFAEYAWIGLASITGVLLFGWAISLIRGAKNDIFSNARNLILILGIVGAAGPIIRVIYGDDLFARGCKTIQVSVSNVQTMLDARNAQLSKREEALYENLDIYDTGAVLDEYDAAFAYDEEEEIEFDDDDDDENEPATQTQGETQDEQ